MMIKVGDIVECIDKGTKVELEYNKKYIVTNVGSDWIQIKGFWQSFYKYRFKVLSNFGYKKGLMCV